MIKIKIHKFFIDYHFNKILTTKVARAIINILESIVYFIENS